MPIDFRIRDYFYPRQILRLQQTLERTQWLPREEIRYYQGQRLRRIVRQAVEQTHHYRELFRGCGLAVEDIDGPEDLRRIPRLTKAQLRARPDAFLARDAGRYAPRWYGTSGSSGEPLRFVLDRGARILEFCYYWRHWRWAGYRIGQAFAELGMHHFLTRAEQRLLHWQPFLRRLMINSTQISHDQARRIADAFRRYRPHFLKGMASSLYHLARCLKDEGISDIGFRGVFSTGEVLTRSCRRLVEAVFHGPVFDSYGHMERTVAVSQCEQGGYHVNADYGILELTKTKDSPHGVRLGQAVGTGLYNMAMPLIRYEVGDDLEMLPNDVRCPCGRTLPLVKAVHGRSEDTIQTPDGRFITSLFVLFDHVEGIRAAQIQQEAPDRVVFLVVPGEGWTHERAEALTALGQGMLGEAMKLRVVCAREEDLLRDTSGKRRAVIGIPLQRP